MKKLLILLTFIFVIMAVHAQSATVIKYEMPAVTVSGTGTGTTTFPIIMGEYDVSIQLIPALSLAGDSLIFSHIGYLSASLDADAWSISYAADTVSSVTDADAIKWYADMKPARLKVIYTGISTDTITITPYAVYKKHANE